MNKLGNIIIGLGMMMSATAANAVIIDFTAMAEAGGSHGESAWTSLDFGIGSVSGTKSQDEAYAYLDAGDGGLGVCGTVKDINTIDTITNSGTNLCNPGSDDNVTVGETLHFSFNQDVTIERIWFNNNHDTDYSLLGNSILINGSVYTFDNGGAYQDSYTLTSYDVGAHSVFDISYFGENFYVSKLLVSVPAPGALALLGLGLIGLVATRRESKKSKVIA